MILRSLILKSHVTVWLVALAFMFAVTAHVVAST